MGCGKSSPKKAAEKEQEKGGAPREYTNDLLKPNAEQQKIRSSRISVIEQVHKNIEDTLTHTNSFVNVTSDGGRSNPTGAPGRDSTLLFREPDQTIIIFDWDDTLCPSYWIRTNPEIEWFRKAPQDKPQIVNPLQMLADQVSQLLDLAHLLGKVILVTNAQRPWVDTSASNFLPSLKPKLKNLPTFYALENLKKLENEGFDAKNGSVLTEVKARAMKDAITEFYSRYENQSWKNMITIGDGLFEHDAVRQVSQQRPHQDPKKKCRTKTVKLLDAPTIAGLIAEVSIVRSWLHKITVLDSDIDIDLSADERVINAWDQQFREDPPAET